MTYYRTSHVPPLNRPTFSIFLKAVYEPVYEQALLLSKQLRQREWDGRRGSGKNSFKWETLWLRIRTSFGERAVQGTIHMAVKAWQEMEQIVCPHSNSLNLSMLAELSLHAASPSPTLPVWQSHADNDSEAVVEQPATPPLPPPPTAESGQLPLIWLQSTKIVFLFSFSHILSLMAAPAIQTIKPWYEGWLLSKHHCFTFSPPPTHTPMVFSATFWNYTILFLLLALSPRIPDQLSPKLTMSQKNMWNSVRTSLLV